MENSARSSVYNDALRNVSIDPIENNYSAVRDEISLESAEDYFLIRACSCQGPGCCSMV